MEFSYTTYIYVEESDLQRMCNLCKDKGYTPAQAFEEICIEWDDQEYYASALIKNDVVEEIERRLAGE